MFSAKKLLLIGFILILLVAIPLTLYFIQQQQEIRSRAQAATTLSFTPATSSVNVGDVVSLDLMVNPNSNLVSFVRLEILYDSTKLATASGTQGKAFEPNTLAFPSVTEGPVYEDGKILVTLSVGSDPTKAIQTPTKVATFQFVAKEPTDTPTQITFGPTQTQVLSIGPQDQASENVLSSTSPAAISIGGETSPTPTPTTTPTLTPTPTVTAGNTLPVCSAFTATVASTSAPVDVTFNVVGSDADGTIEKVTINYGDNNVINYTENLGVKNINTNYTHTYTAAGQYTAQALLTDDQGGVSSAQSCQTTVTIAGEPTATPTGTLTPTATSTPTTPTTGVDTPTPTLEAPGPGATVIGIGAFFTVLSIIGAILFFTL
ncbi:MAG: hypothetical protein KatS3mg089_0233 [Patescibacteria group bacterium]|nr:MAG: hypothetical protein KatS3mg089_0233 [Patescibacteria group bacterium]